MNAWVQRKGNNVSRLSAQLKVPTSIVHGWYWRDSSPSEEMRPLVCAVVGGRPEQWDTPADRERKADLRERLGQIRRNRGGEAA